MNAKIAGTRLDGRTTFLDLCRETVLPSICSRIPSTLFSAMTDANPAVAYYHMVSDTDVPHVKHLYPFRSTREFTEDIDTFCRRFRVIGLTDVLEHLKRATPLPRNGLLLTFDDGFREVHDIVAPILRQKGIPATFFLISGCLDNRDMAHHNKISLLIERLGSLKDTAQLARIHEVLTAGGIVESDVRRGLLSIDYARRALVDDVADILGCDVPGYLSRQQPYLTTEQVQALLSQGFSIGGHTIDHPSCSRLPYEEQIRQTVESVRVLRERFSLTYGAFAFPHGDDRVSNTFFEAVHAAGVDVTFGTAGIVKDRRARHLQRFATENSLMPAARVLGRYYAKSLFRGLTAKGWRRAEPGTAKPV